MPCNTPLEYVGDGENAKEDITQELEPKRVELQARHLCMVGWEVEEAHRWRFVGAESLFR